MKHAQNYLSVDDSREIKIYQKNIILGTYLNKHNQADT